MKIKILFLLLVVSSVVGLKLALGWSEPNFTFDSKQQRSIASENTPENTDSVISEEEAVDVEPAGVEPRQIMKKKLKWKQPNYSGQENALGWSPTAFAVPVGMEERVNFWVRIYTQHTTTQGLIHDSLHPSIVYEAIDFTEIENHKVLSLTEKRKAKKKLIEGKKKEIIDRLNRLAKVSESKDLTGEDLRIWNMFSAFDENNKFSEATHKKRIRFQLGQSDRFLQGIYYSGRYLHQMEDIFRAKGIPLELTRLPFVESSFNINARSRVGASGIWQFMRYTGRRFMRIHGSADERNDPIRATEAAARLFRLNYEMLNDWPLAVTGYNHGPSGVQRVVRKFKTNNIADLVDERHGRFGFASANFYASFLAALEVEKNANKYYGDNVIWDEPMKSKDIRLTRSINKKILEKWFSQDLELAKTLNPHLTRSFWQGYGSIGAKDFIRVPVELYESVNNDLMSLRNVATTFDTEKFNDYEYYSVGQGETLSDIAQNSGVSLKALKELNDIENPRRIRAGQKLKLPKKK